MKQRFIVAVKEIKDNKICPGRVLGQFRALDFALRARGRLAAEAGFGLCTWKVGIFQNGKCVE